MYLKYTYLVYELGQLLVAGNQPKVSTLSRAYPVPGTLNSGKWPQHNY